MDKLLALLKWRIMILGSQLDELAKEVKDAAGHDLKPKEASLKEMKATTQKEHDTLVALFLVVHALLR